MEFNQYKDSYSQTLDELFQFSGKAHDFFTRAKAEVLNHIIKRNFAQTKELSVLDIGCGHGFIHKYLQFPGLKLSGVEVADEVITLAQQANPGVEYYCYDGIRLPFPDHHFNLCFAICVMHHVPPKQWKLFVAEMYRVLKPGGLAVIFEHNPFNPLTRYVVANNDLDKNAVLLSSPTLKKLFRESGFMQEKSRNILFTPFSSKLFRWLDNKLGWLPMGAQFYATGIKP